MDKAMYAAIESHMLSCMGDSAHDKEHIYRVLHMALDLAGHEGEDVDRDILTAAALLHDIGREDQFRDPSLCHAEAGSVKAYDFLLSLGGGGGGGGGAPARVHPYPPIPLGPSAAVH